MRRSSNRRTFLFAVGLATFMVACQQQVEQPQTPPDTRAADEAAIRESDTKWSEAAGTKQADQFVSFFADDASLFPPNTPAMTTKDDIHKWASDLMANPGFAVSWKPTKADVSRGGDIGYTIGTYELTLNDPKGKPVTDRGKYLTVWKKQADGNWKVVADTFNSDLPAEGAATH